MKPQFFKCLSILSLMFMSVIVFGKESVYTLDLREQNQQKNQTHLNFSATSPDGTRLSVNNQYFEKNGQPWFPIMGEIHYLRYPEKYWEEEIMRMKSNLSLGLIILQVLMNILCCNKSKICLNSIVLK